MEETTNSEGSQRRGGRRALPPDQKLRQVNVHMHPEQIAAIHELASQEQRGFANWVRLAVSEKIARQQSGWSHTTEPKRKKGRG